MQDRLLTVLAVAVFVRSVTVLGSLFDPLGIRSIKAHLRGASEARSAFLVKGPYRWVRHPLYSCVLLLFWCTPDVTADRLLLDMLWTSWICIATVLEERDLVAVFGDAYRDYQRKVPMLIPWKGRMVIKPLAPSSVSSSTLALQLALQGPVSTMSPRLGSTPEHNELTTRQRISSELRQKSRAISQLAF